MIDTRTPAQFSSCDVNEAWHSAC